MTTLLEVNGQISAGLGTGLDLSTGYQAKTNFGRGLVQPTTESRPESIIFNFTLRVLRQLIAFLQ